MFCNAYIVNDYSHGCIQKWNGQNRLRLCQENPTGGGGGGGSHGPDLK